MLIPWTLSLFLAMTLFTTFTYLPPDVPDRHPHIAHNEITTATASLVQKNEPVVVPASSDNVVAVVAAAADAMTTNHTLPQRVDKPISFGAVDLESLHLPVDAKTIILDEVPLNHPMQQNPILAVLRQALVEEISVDDWKELPNLAKNLRHLYGSRIVSSPQSDNSNNNDNNNHDGPLVLGMETCHAYRDAVPPSRRYVGAAGMFNTGTNALEHHLTHNILNIGSVWQVPWGTYI